MKKSYGNSSKPYKGNSAPQNTAVGSGSRPNRSKIKIPTSAPMNNRTLARAPSGWLK